LLTAKNLDHDAKFYIARYGSPEQVEHLHKHHQPLDDKTQKQLRATVKMYTGDPDEYRNDDGLDKAKHIWSAIKGSLKNVS